jgi:Tol biopolymer transport system component
MKMKIHRVHRRFWKLPTVPVTIAVGLLMAALFVFPVKAERWSTPTQVTSNLNIADDWGGPSISSDGNRIVLQHKVDGYYEVFVVNSDGTGLKQVTSDQRHYVHLSISGDGSKIAVTSYMPTAPNSFSNAETFVVNSDGTGSTSLISGPVLYCKPVISGDGTKVAVIAASGNLQEMHTELFVVNSDGAGLRQLTNNSWVEQYPSISGDGSKIAFCGYAEGNNSSEIFVINSDGTGLKQVTNSTAENEFPSISGDGSKIAFLSRDTYTDGGGFGINDAICVVNSDGTGLTTVINSTDPKMQPSINYDGSRLTFASLTQGNSNVFVVNSDGTGLHQITQNTKMNNYPSISGDGSRIAFITFENGVNGEIFVSVDLDKDSNAPVTAATYDGRWHVADFSITLTASDDLSGVAETYYKINNGATQNIAANGQPLIATEGANNKLEYWSVDVAGNEEPHKVLNEIKLDKTRPTGSIAINNGNVSASETSVTLNISATDNIKVAQMHLRNNETEWTAWETYSASKNWTLTSGDGEKIVFVQFKDDAGLVSDSYSDTIMLETVKENDFPGAFPTALLVAGVAGIVVVAVALLYLKKRKARGPRAAS